MLTGKQRHEIRKLRTDPITQMSEQLPKQFSSEKMNLDRGKYLILETELKILTSAFCYV